MTGLSEELDLIAAEFALGTLEGAEKARAEALEAADPAFRLALAGWRAKFAALDETAIPLTPPPRLWDRIEAGAAEKTPEKASRIAAEAAPHGWFHQIWASLGFWRPLGVAGALASLMLALALGAALNRGPIAPVYVAVLNTGDGKAAAVVNAFADGTVELIPLERIDVPQGRIIEVWTLQTRERGPVSIGRMDQARRMKLDLKDLLRPDANHLFELTLEPAGGSPTGKPTGPILMKGLAARSI